MELRDKSGTGFEDSSLHEKTGNSYTVNTCEHYGQEKTITNDKKIFLATLCILLVELCENLVFHSLNSGIVLYCTSKLDIGEADAVTIFQAYVGVSQMTPVLGGFIADSYTGRFNAMFGSSFLCFLGTFLLSASAVEYDTWGWESLSNTGKRTMFAIGVTSTALGIGGLKANLKSFGAQQVQVLGARAIRAYFSWNFCADGIGALASYTGVAFIQQNVSFAWGFFIPAVAMLVAIIVFVLGRRFYIMTHPTGSVLRIAWGICVEGGCKSKPSKNPSLPEGSEKRILARAKTIYGGKFQGHLVDGLVSVIRVTPFCLLVVLYWTIFSQVGSTFLAQSQRMDLRVANAYLPATGLNAAGIIIALILVPIVDRVIHPCFEKLKMPLSYLKRIGIGMILGVLAMITTGVVEIYRKDILEEQPIVQVLGGQNFTASSLSVFVQIPQFALLSVSQIFIFISTNEFAFNQAPVAMQGVLIGLFQTASGVGNWVSSAILAIVRKVTEEDPWWSDEINDCKMEYLLFLFGGLLLVNILIFCVVAHFYTYQDPASFEEHEINVHEETVVVGQKESQEGEICDKASIDNTD